MNVVLRNFKSIPCPAGNACTQPECPWKHPREAEPVPAVSKVTTVGSHTIPGDADSETPRKRQRLDQSGHTVSSVHAQAEPKTEKHSEVVTGRKAVSPPPLKRKATSQPSTTESQLSFKNSPRPANPDTGTSHRKTSIPATVTANPLSKPAPVNPALGVPQSTTATIVKPTPTPKTKSAPKIETLNPRHLSHSPAAHTFRYKALQMLHAQFVRLNSDLKKDASEEEEKLVLSDQQLIQIALDEEEKAATDKPAIYKGTIQSKIMTYKRMTTSKWKEERVAARKKESATPAKKSHLGLPREIKTGLTPAQEVKFARRLLTPITDLAAYKYVPVAPSNDDIAEARRAEFDSKGWEICDRCGTRFQVFPGRREEDGALTSGGTCTHHPGKKYFPPRSADSTFKPPQQWTCCSETVGDSAGCTTGPTHVFKTTDAKRLAFVMPFMHTPENPTAPQDRAVCFDCEMCYTVKGIELVRLTATSWPDGAMLLDVLVQPLGEILDLNSRYSGVHPEDMVNAKLYVSADDDTDSEDEITAVNDQSDLKEGEIAEDPTEPARKQMTKVSSPYVARDLFFKLISPDTPLIGHALENDLNSMRIIHPTIVDTALLYPHTRGLPMRMSLKMLMKQHLNTAIQMELGPKAMGHDSAEDARAAGELVRLRVETEWQQLQRQGWKIIDDEFVPPEGHKGGKLTEAYIENSRTSVKGNIGVDEPS